MKIFIMLISLILMMGMKAHSVENVVLSKGSVEGTPITINGEEVWPFIDGQPSPYPDGRIWYVNDPAVKQVIRDCMRDSSQLLASWVTNPHDPIHKALMVASKYGVTTDYFLWTNDYTEGEVYQTSSYRRASSWNWENSYLKFESTVNYRNSEGVEVCYMPNKKQAFDMINYEAQKKAQEQNKIVEFNQMKPTWNIQPQEAGEDEINLND